jgi:dTDP-4-amino-4,6-dideoxygalactose transaminase
MATFSLHPVKTITMGEGGVITTTDADLARHLRRLRNHGIERDPQAFVQDEEALDSDGNPNPWYYELSELGFNYRASDMQCALGRNQLAKLTAFIARRRELVTLYDDALQQLAPHVMPLARTPDNDPGWHLYVALIDFESAGVPRATVMHRLRSCGIGTQVHYVPLHRQPYYRNRYGARTLPGADQYYARCLSLPLFPDMADTDVTRVVEGLADALEA